MRQPLRYATLVLVISALGMPVAALARIAADTSSALYGGDNNRDRSEDVEQVRKSLNSAGATLGDTSIISQSAAGSTSGSYTYTGGYVSGYGGNYPGGTPSPQAPTDAEIAAGQLIVRASTPEEAAQFGPTICIAKPVIGHRDYVGPSTVFLPGSSCAAKTTAVATTNNAPASVTNTSAGDHAVTVTNDRGTTITTNGSTWQPTWKVTSETTTATQQWTDGEGNSSPVLESKCSVLQSYDTGERRNSCVPIAPKPFSYKLADGSQCTNTIGLDDKGGMVLGSAKCTK